MPEQVQKILNQILEWWKKFNNKQRALIISIVAVVVIALGILAAVMTTPSMTTLYICENYIEAAQIKELLDSDETINYSTDSEGLVFYVEEEDEATASMLLGSNKISTVNYSMADVVDGSFTRTEADKKKLYKELLEKKFADHISQLSMVESCTVDLELPDDDGTILSKEQNASAAITLNLKSDMEPEQANALALYVASQLGNDTTEGITIIDQHSYIIYNGKESQNTIGTVTTQLTFQQKLEQAIKDEISDVLVKSHVFSNVEIAMNLDVNFDKTETIKNQIGIPSGMDGGAMTQQSLYDMVTNNGTTGGVPGTDTNDDTSYVIEDGLNGKTEISESDTMYDYDRFVTTIVSNGGDIRYENCSTTVMATKYIVYDEAQLRATGALDDMTWEEFKATNGTSRVVEVDDSYIQLVANATGFPSNKITFLCYEEPKFVDEIEEKVNIADYAPIVMAVLIFVLLGYVVFRSTRTAQEVEELEPEISVETLLETTANAQDQLEDIGYNEKSDVRVMIEKFVDENPEAVASLLRNWLNEDWE